MEPGGDRDVTEVPNGSPYRALPALPPPLGRLASRPGRRRPSRKILGALLGSAVAHLAVVALLWGSWHPLRRDVEPPAARGRFVGPVFLVHADGFSDDDDPLVCGERLDWPRDSAVYACFDREQARKSLLTCGFEPWAPSPVEKTSWSSAEMGSKTPDSLESVRATVDACYEVARVPRAARLNVRVARRDEERAFAWATPEDAGADDPSLLCCVREAMLGVAPSLAPGHAARYEL